MNALYLTTMATLVLVACNKSPYGMPATPPSGTARAIVGKWTIDSVTTVAYDLNGRVLNGRGNVYIDPPNNYYLFNADNTWRESLLPDSLADAGLNGKYTVTSDTTFTISGENRTDELCTIRSLSDSVFIFSHTRPANFNGTQPGYLEYIFTMTK